MRPRRAMRERFLALASRPPAPARWWLARHAARVRRLVPALFQPPALSRLAEPPAWAWITEARPPQVLPRPPALAQSRAPALSPLLARTPRGPPVWVSGWVRAWGRAPAQLGVGDPLCPFLGKLAEVGHYCRVRRWGGVPKRRPVCQGVTKQATKARHGRGRGTFRSAGRTREPMQPFGTDSASRRPAARSMSRRAATSVSAAGRITRRSSTRRRGSSGSGRRSARSRTSRS